MRFEIGPGGGFIVLAGLLGLSAAVFFLGMISGREMAQSEQGQSQLASVYPMPAGAPAASPPQAAAPAPVASATPKPPATAAVASATIPPPALPKPPLAHKAPPRSALASVTPKHPTAPAAEESSTDSASSSDSSTSSNEPDSSPDQSTASAPPPSTGTHGHGYNIVIDAAMDRAAAYKMSSRLLALGYTSHIVPTQISGQTWYRVQVGPYPSSDDARAAQAQLRAAYTARYVNRAGAAGTRGGAAAAAGAGATSAGSADTDTSDSGATDAGTDDSGGGDSAPSEPSAPSD